MNTEASYEPHPAAELFPMMPTDQYETFREDIRKNGFQQDIVLYKGQILDGRNRYKAAIELNMLDELPICEIDDDTNFDPYQWVISRNLHRRHLTDSQRAAIAARLATKKRGDNQHTKKEDSSIGGCSIAQAADLMQVSPKSVERAKIVIEHGSPELIESVERGEIAVSKAAQQVKKPKATKGVQVDSKPLEATDSFEQVPKEKWRTLLRVKRDFLATSLAYDCQCLVEFCQEAELVYKDCGFNSAAEMIQNGYELDTFKIEVAVALLSTLSSFDCSKIDEIVSDMKEK